jgi:hypothetical protein
LTLRFVGIGLHKRFLVIAAVDARHNVVLKRRRVSLNELPVWAAQHLAPPGDPFDVHQLPRWNDQFRPLARHKHPMWPS